MACTKATVRKRAMMGVKTMPQTLPTKNGAKRWKNAEDQY